jgi:AcrR family transcriptional regulator
MLADRICQTMLHAGLGLYHRYPADRVASVLCKILLHGVAVRPVKNAQLDRSPAMSAVERVLQQWNEADDTVEDERTALIRAAARTEFGRKGYEVTTIRDIASAAGLSPGSIYRVIGSKEELLTSVMRSFAAKAVAGWSAAFGSDSTTVEKLDAGAWLQINVIDRFYDEFKIGLAWLRQVPPDIPKLGWSFSALIRALKAELTDGVRSGEIRIDSPSAELTARCVVDLTWMPENIIRSAGKRTALAHARDTLLRGVAKRR